VRGRVGAFGLEVVPEDVGAAPLFACRLHVLAVPRLPRRDTPLRPVLGAVLGEHVAPVRCATTLGRVDVAAVRAGPAPRGDQVLGPRASRRGQAVVALVGRLGGDPEIVGHVDVLPVDPRDGVRREVVQLGVALRREPARAGVRVDGHDPRGAGGGVRRAGVERGLPVRCVEDDLGVRRPAGAVAERLTGGQRPGERAVLGHVRPVDREGFRGGVGRRSPFLVPGRQPEGVGRVGVHGPVDGHPVGGVGLRVGRVRVDVGADGLDPVPLVGGRQVGVGDDAVVVGVVDAAARNLVGGVGCEPVPPDESLPGVQRPVGVGGIRRRGRRVVDLDRHRVVGVVHLRRVERRLNPPPVDVVLERQRLAGRERAGGLAGRGRVGWRVGGGVG
jgi:hypothetical protein